MDVTTVDLCAVLNWVRSWMLQHFFDGWCLDAVGSALSDLPEENERPGQRTRAPRPVPAL
jgi:hypothetical protein